MKYLQLDDGHYEKAFTLLWGEYIPPCDEMKMHICTYTYIREECSVKYPILLIWTIFFTEFSKGKIKKKVSKN